MDQNQVVKSDVTELLEQMSDAYYQVDSNWQIQFANQNTERYWGLNRDEILGKSLWDLFPNYRKIKGSQELDRAMREYVPVRFETFSPVLRRYVEAEAYPTANGGLSIYFRDVTDRKMAEMKQLSSDQMLRLAIDATGIGFWKWDIAADRMSAIYSSPNIPSEWHDGSARGSLWNVHPDDVERVYEALMKARDSLQPYKCEYRRILPNGETVWILSQGEVLPGKLGNAEQMIGVNYDITERINREQHERVLAEKRCLEKRQRELLETLDGTTEGSWILDPVNLTKTISLNWRKRLGIDEQETAGNQYLKSMETVHPDDRSKVRQDYYNAVSRHDARVVSEYRMMTADKGYIWVQSRAKINYDGAGKPVMLYGTTSDISERKNLELQLIEKNRLIIDFFTNISHEFRTPLSIILMGLSLIHNRITESDFSEKERTVQHLKMVRQNSYRLQRLIGNLLDITKIDAGFMLVRYANIDIALYLKELVDSVEEFARGKGIALALRGCDEALRIPVDVDKIERVVLNLLSNAIKHTPKGGSILVQLTNLRERIRVAVRDEGEGIPEEKREIIFDRFRLVNTSLTRNSEGCGIGLSLSKALIDLLGGTIWFECNEGKGTTFCFELPVIRDPLLQTCDETNKNGLPLSKKVEMELSDIIR